MCMLKSLKLYFPYVLKTNIYIHVNMTLDFPISFVNALVFCQSECTRLYQTVNTVVFFTHKQLKIPNQKGEHSCKSTELSLNQKE